MKKLFWVTVMFAFVLGVLFVGTASSAYASPSEKSCWGQASKVFAQTGEMGEHASQFPTPRLGLRNLARALFDQGVIEADTMQALGGFVVAELGISVAACE